MLYHETGSPSARLTMYYTMLPRACQYVLFNDDRLVDSRGLSAQRVVVAWAGAGAEAGRWVEGIGRAPGGVPPTPPGAFRPYAWHESC